MFHRPTVFALLLSCFASIAAAQPADPISPADLRAHIAILASDDFGGRAPASEGERKTTDYLARAFREAGLSPAGEKGGWLQPVPLIERTTLSHEIAFVKDGREIGFRDEMIALQGRDARVSLQAAPVVFVGHGARLADRGIDQLAGAELAGAVAILLFEGPDVPGFPGFSERVKAVTEAGAGAVIAVTGADIQWEFVTRNYRQPTHKLAEERVAPVVGAMPLEAAKALFQASGADFLDLLDGVDPSFRAVTLPLKADLKVETKVRPYVSHNVVGRLTGSNPAGQSLLYLAHWDHLGECRAAGAPDRLCNGAVDNASGLAAMIEIAERLSAGPAPARDVLFLATTAEELGLLGAEQFARHPVVPAHSIVAAINLDTVALHPAGGPVAILGRAHRPLVALVEEAVRAAGRPLDSDEEAEIMIQRQDGWALTRAGVPTVMIGGAISDMARLRAFLSGPYHSPEDELGPELLLEGAAEDSNLLVSIGRRLADPQIYPAAPAQ